jgi:hypothetical protein
VDSSANRLKISPKSETNVEFQHFFKSVLSLGKTAMDSFLGNLLKGFSQIKLHQL